MAPQWLPLSLRTRNCLPFASPWVIYGFVNGVCIAHIFNFVLCFRFVCLHSAIHETNREVPKKNREKEIRKFIIESFLL